MPGAQAPKGNGIIARTRGRPWKKRSRKDIFKLSSSSYESRAQYAGLAQCVLTDISSSDRDAAVCSVCFVCVLSVL
jgi:hypothetical protein